MFETEQKLNWSQSELACEQKGGYLATLESMEEILWVKRYKAARHTLRSQMYLGGKKIDNLWYWVRGNESERIQNFYWGQFAPSWYVGDLSMWLTLAGSDEHWQFSSWKSSQHKFDDVFCVNRYRYICEHDPVIV